jgi:hypothetical protein
VQICALVQKLVYCLASNQAPVSFLARPTTIAPFLQAVVEYFEDRLQADENYFHDVAAFKIKSLKLLVLVENWNEKLAKGLSCFPGL